ncbi:MAG: DNA alkylation response protein, partial [Candidatus Eremiobacteraeota bacterium]|nr:DNA alkylation response protein [Candidatus Eremiobacteraeota bacterium]
ALFARIARAVDEDDARLRRIGTAIGKYWVCKRAAAFVGEALEVLGGNGYVEESALPRLYREAPLNSIWEGSGNINALDVLRVITKEPHALEALLAEIGPAPELGPLVRDADESSARFVVERLALHWQAAILRRSAPYYVSDAFDASRIRGKGGRAFGTLPKKTEFEAILARI